MNANHLINKHLVAELKTVHQKYIFYAGSIAQIIIIETIGHQVQVRCPNRINPQLLTS
jgi:hypothetical protein